MRVDVCHHIVGNELFKISRSNRVAFEITFEGGSVDLYIAPVTTLAPGTKEALRSAPVLRDESRSRPLISVLRDSET